MKLTGQLIKSTAIVAYLTVENNENIAFNEKLEKSLLEICKQFQISVPLWLEKNTREFVSYRKTFFTNEQFIENFPYDRFEIKLEKE